MSERTQDLAVRALIDRDEQAWQELFAEMTPRLWGLAERLGVPADRCEDLLQTTWYKMLKADWSAEVPFVPFIFTVLRNAWTDFCRSDRRRPAPLPLLDGDDKAAVVPDLFGALEKAQRLRECLEKLTERDRKIIQWHHGEEKLSHAEIGRRLGLSESQVKNLCYRAVRRLLALLGGDKPPRTRGAGKVRRVTNVILGGQSSLPPESSHDQT